MSINMAHLGHVLARPHWQNAPQGDTEGARMSNGTSVRRTRCLAVVMVVGALVAALTVGAAQASPSDDGRPRNTAPEGMITASVSAGDSHTCGVRTDATVACWGDNTFNQSTPPTTGVTTFTQVSAGGAHTCGVHTDATVACWGDNSEGQSTPPTTGVTTFIQVSADAGHTCGVRTDATVACWGHNFFGQSTPPTTGVTTFIQVSAGAGHTCGVRTDATVACWGNNGNGESTPPTTGVTTFTQVSAGRFHTCGVRTDATVACWGFNGSGQSTPPTTGVTTFTQVSAGGAHTCGVRTDATVACWGFNFFNQSTPPTTGVTTFTQVSAGEFHTCGVRTDATVACWGSNGYNQSTPPAGTFASPSVEAGGSHTCGVRTDATVACWGNNSFNQSTPPTTGVTTFAQVSAGNGHTCAVRTDATVACWGLNNLGQSTPPTTGVTTFTQVSVGAFHTCGVRTDATVACWGSNGFGQSTPPTTGVRTFTEVSAGGGHTCGVRTDATVACWGDNRSGQATPPTTGVTTFTQVSAGDFHTCGVRTDATVACWGLNFSGQSTPPTTGVTTFTQVSTGGVHTCGVRTDGTVACWGYNVQGQARLVIASAAPPAGVESQAYSHQFTTSYARPAPTFTVSTGTLPAGLALSPTGLLSGTPASGSAGSYPLVITAANGLAPPGTQSFTMVISSLAATITGTPPAGTVGVVYSFAYTVTNSNGCTLTGALPAGLGFTQATCTIAGTPTAAGSFPISVVANGPGGNSAPNASTLTVAKATPTIATVASAGNLVGAPVRDTATLSGGFNPTGTVTFRLFSDAGCANQVFIATNPLGAPSDWFTPAVAGTYRWTATYNGDANNNSVSGACNAPNESVTLAPFEAPGYTRIIEGDHLGPVTVTAGESVLIKPNARVVGPVTVQSGGALTVQNAKITKGLSADNPSFLSICGSEISPPSLGAQALGVSNAAVPIRIGDPATGCAANRFAGQVHLTANLAVTFGANAVSHAATVNNGGPGATVIKANTFLASLACSGNNPAPTNSGEPNTAGSRTGQCAGL
jgi:alpha-tubulin suppressor-like RCC1 family protein